MHFSVINNLSFCINKLSDLCYDLALFLKKQSAELNPYTSHNNLDKQIAKILPSLLNSKTFYIEVGANDGITQSNTYFLEKLFGARGMLIEASPSLFEKCCINRSKNNIFEHYALVSSQYKKPFVELIYGNLFTTLSDTSNMIPKDYAKLGVEVIADKGVPILVINNNNLKKNISMVRDFIESQHG